MSQGRGGQAGQACGSGAGRATSVKEQRPCFGLTARILEEGIDDYATEESHDLSLGPVPVVAELHISAVAAQQQQRIGGGRGSQVGAKRPLRGNCSADDQRECRSLGDGRKRGRDEHRAPQEARDHLDPATRDLHVHRVTLHEKPTPPSGLQGSEP